jgi:hypothetical protein
MLSWRIGVLLVRSLLAAGRVLMTPAISCPGILIGTQIGRSLALAAISL